MPSGSVKKTLTTTNQLENGDKQYNGEEEKEFMDTKNGNTENNNSHNTKTITSFDPIEYVQRTRITKPVLAKPATDPLQFIKVKPCHLYQTAQEQLKKVEEVKKVKEIKKEEPEDWQSNLDNWKSSRRKRVEHIIDRVVEAKKFEMEDFDRTRRKSKTFNEMLEERGTRGKISLPVYTEDDSNDLSDLGIGTSSASGKSSLSEDFDNHSVMSDSQESTTTNTNHMHENGNNYEQPSLLANSQEIEYTYEGAIEDYKSRISRSIQSSVYSDKYKNQNNKIKESLYSYKSNNLTSTPSLIARDAKIIKTQEKLFNYNNNNNNNHNIFEINNKENNLENNFTINNKDLPKINISRKKELFENKNEPTLWLSNENKITNRRLSDDFLKTKSIKERLSSFGLTETETINKDEKIDRIPDKLISLKDRLTNLEKQITVPEKLVPIVSTKIDVPIVSLKDRLSSLHSNISTNDSNGIVKDEPKFDKNNIIDDKIVNINSSITNGTNSCDLVTNNVDRCVVFEVHHKSKNQLNENNNLINDFKVEKNVEVNNYINEGNINQNEADDHNELIMKIEENIIEDKFQEISSDIINIDESQDAMEDIFNDSQIDELENCLTPEPITDDQETSVLEALEIAFDAIDRESDTDIPSSTEINLTIDHLTREPIYEDIIDDIELNQNQTNNSNCIISNNITSSHNQHNNNNYVMGENINNIEIQIKEEPYYQVPKSCEPYYEIPKPPKPVPLYENVDIFYPANHNLNNNRMSLNSPKEPPKEKPPPPPIDLSEDDETMDSLNHSHNNEHELNQNANIDNNSKEQQDAFRRINSTRRIKNEIRTQRSSFLGLTGNSNENYLEVSIAPPPDMITLLKEERRIEKQLYLKAGLCDNSDSGVSENHSRQSSELFTSSEELDDINSSRKDDNTDSFIRPIDDEIRMKSIENQIREQEEVLRVERELLQLEQEELKRQRDNLLLRESLARNKILTSTNRRSMTDIHENGMSYINIPNNNLYEVYQVQTDFRKSMPDLQNYHMSEFKPNPPSPPAKPMRVQYYQSGQPIRHSTGNFIQTEHHENNHINHNSIHIRNNSAPVQTENGHLDETVLKNVHSGNMTKHAIHALSAVPKPKYTDVWVQQNQAANRKSYDQTIYQNTLNINNNLNNINGDGFNNGLYRKSISTEYIREPPIRKVANNNINTNSNLTNFNNNYNNKHWLIQEAEQRRIEQQQRGAFNRHSMPGPITNYSMHSTNSLSTKPNNSATTASWINKQQTLNNSNNISGNKPLPDSIIQTLTQRVHSRGIGERKNLINRNSIPIHGSDTMINQSNNLLIKTQENILSVSGKKKCSHCKEELGRGAAMIIESLRLFYHIDCFKCCVCCIQLGDGLNGTDVRVRNHKLHCHNCYSSDDGIKFSCV